MRGDLETEHESDVWTKRREKARTERGGRAHARMNAARAARRLRRRERWDTLRFAQLPMRKKIIALNFISTLEELAKELSRVSHSLESTSALAVVL